MANIFNDISNTLRNGSPLSRIILISIVVFVVVNLIGNISGMATGGINYLEYYLSVPAYWFDFLLQPWSIVTYLFLHAGLGHIFWNLLLLYWFGQIYIEYQSNQKFISTFFIGGLAGAVLYLIAYNLVFLAGGNPSFAENAHLMGASAGILAVVFATATLIPDYELTLILVGPVRIKYIAAGIFVISTVLDFSSNTGGKIAHIGGALYGYLFIRGLRSGVDYSTWFWTLINSTQALFSSKPKMRVVKNNYKSNKTSAPNNKSSMSAAEKERRINQILDKISASGYDSLSSEEKEFLFQMKDE